MIRPATLAVATVCAIALTIGTAQAKPRKPHRIAPAESSQCLPDNDGRQVCGGAIHRASESHIQSGVVIGGRPAGCPRAFCGCEASLYLFGRIIPELNLAANWLRKFPRTSPAPGMAAARRGHVFVLLSHVEGSNWMVRDGNSGGHLTRLHVRSIAGYGIVDPHGSRLAMN
jgi:hypothetical protein